MHRLVGDRRAVGDVGDDVDGEEQPDDLLDRAEDHPARAGQDHGAPPAPGVLRRPRRHEPQVVDLLGDLGDQRQAHAGGQHHRAEVGPPCAVLALVGEEGADRLGVADQQVDERDHHQDQPERRGPQLELGQHLHAVDHQREDDQRRDRVPRATAGCPRPELQPLGHDRALEGEEDEGEGREDDVGDHRAVVAEAAAAGDQVEVDVVARGVVGEREAGQRRSRPRRPGCPTARSWCRRRCRCWRRSRSRRGRRCHRAPRSPPPRSTSGGSAGANRRV